MKPYTDDKEVNQNYLDKGRGKFKPEKGSKGYISKNDKEEAKNANRSLKKKTRQQSKQELKKYLR